MIRAVILADSLNAYTGDRITTYVLTYPRFIHSEIMTHRVFSRNAASSRAIPVKRMLKAIEQEPALPVEWGTNQPGMQAGEALDEPGAMVARAVWLKARDDAMEHATCLRDLGVHKQIANRILEPWMHMTTLVTATEWGNFFRLRAHPDAQPEFQTLAYKMLKLYLDSTPHQKYRDEWHVPFGDRFIHPDTTVRIKQAVARCARISYLTFEKEDDPAQDVALHDRLLAAGHMSPFEHVARVLQYPIWSGNFRGWQQYRHMVETVSHDITREELLEIWEKRPTRKRSDA